MPFTLSHPLAAIALRRTHLPLAAMVAGSMAPDVPLFVHEGAGYSFTRSLPGSFTVDLIYSVVGVLVWFTLLRDPLVDLAPAWARERVAPRARPSRRDWILAVPAALIGSFTHIGWDELTHEDRWGTAHIAWLREQHLHYAGYHLAQLVSTVVGLAGCVAWAVWTLRQLPRNSRPSRAAWLAVRGPAVGVGLAGAATMIVLAVRFSDEGLHAASIDAAEVGVATLALAVAALAMLWHVATSGSRAG